MVQQGALLGLALPVAALVSVAGEALPPFHADWSPQEQEALRALSVRFHQVMEREVEEHGGLDEGNSAYKRQVEGMLAQAVQTGRADVYGPHGESLGQVAAYLGCPEALKALVRHGGDPAHPFRGVHGDLRPMTAVTDLVAGGIRDAEGRPAYTQGQRQELLQWLVGQGLELSAVADALWLGSVLSLVSGEEGTLSWVLRLGLPAPETDVCLVPIGISLASLEEVKALVEGGILSPSYRDAEGRTVVQVLAGAAWRPGVAEKLRVLLDAGFPLVPPEGGAGSKGQVSPLQLALEELQAYEVGDEVDRESAESLLEVAELLLQRGCRLERYPWGYFEGTRQRVVALLRRYEAEPCFQALPLEEVDGGEDSDAPSCQQGDF